MRTYSGGCHCGRVRFEIRADIDKLIDCNCSMCTQKGMLHVPVIEECFELLSGEEDISVYQFKSKTAKHFFCKHCGIHPFGRPRRAPNQYTVNARCLDDRDAILSRSPIEIFNGKEHPADREG